MPKILTHVIAETQSEHLSMKDGWDLVAVLDVTRVGAERLWSVVVSRDVVDEPEGDE